MEKLGVTLLVLLLVVFIGNVVYNESFADCNSPGQMTWTITLNPDSTTCGSGASSRSASGTSGGNRKESSDASGNGVRVDGAKGLGSTSSNTPAASSPSSSTNPAPKPASSLINLSLTDLMALVGSTRDSSGNHPPPYNYRYVSMSIPQPPAPPAPQIYVTPGAVANSFNSQFSSDLRKSSIDPVIGSYIDSLNSADFQDNRIPIASYATRQGVQYVKGAPQMNPAENPEYIRKDSIPCYACSL